jgi:hypothetical protein
MWLRSASNLKPSYLSLLSAGIIGASPHAYLLLHVNVVRKKKRIFCVL